MGSAGVILDPQAIEDKSFAIIDAEIGRHSFDARQWPVVRRIIHTTADFEFAKNTRFSPGAVDSAVRRLQKGGRVICDTNMVLAGVNKSRLTSFHCSIDCHVADPDVASAARAEGVTRSTMAIRKGVDRGGNIFLVGNAPTALFELLRLVANDIARPDLIVGVPVGFVGAAESKLALMQTELPYITCEGRKGGSPVAAAILNALMLLAAENS